MSTIITSPQNLQTRTTQQLTDRLTALTCEADLILLELQERPLATEEGDALTLNVRHLEILRDGFEQIVYEACEMWDQTLRSHRLYTPAAS